MVVLLVLEVGVISVIEISRLFVELGWFLSYCVFLVFWIKEVSGIECVEYIYYCMI